MSLWDSPRVYTKHGSYRHCFDLTCYVHHLVGKPAYGMVGNCIHNGSVVMQLQACRNTDVHEPLHCTTMLLHWMYRT